MGKNSKTEKSGIQIQSLSKLYTLLLLQSKESITGYRILKLLEKDLGTRASPTHVYNFLKELKEEGYLEEIEVEDSKRAKGFKMTSSGETFVKRILNRFDNLIDVAIRPKLTICAHCGAKLYEDFHVEEINAKKMNFCCIHCAKVFKEHEHSIMKDK